MSSIASSDQLAAPASGQGTDDERADEQDHGGDDERSVEAVAERLLRPAVSTLPTTPRFAATIGLAAAAAAAFAGRPPRVTALITSERNGR